MYLNYLKKQTGLTLIELLAVIAILSIAGTVVFTTLSTTMKQNTHAQSYINLRQEANIIITQLRQQHQAEKTNYNLDYEALLQDSYSFASIHVKQIDPATNHDINITNRAQADPSKDLYVNFTLESNSESFEIDTIIEAASIHHAKLNIDIPKEENKFYDYLDLENIFVYGKQFVFNGTATNGPNATMVIQGGLQGKQINGGALNNVSNIFINGPVDFDGGSAGFGSVSHKGKMYVNGDLSLWSGSRDIYGDVYVNGDLRLKDARIHGNIYVTGDVELGWTPKIDQQSRIHYKGNLIAPDWYDQSILDKMVKSNSIEPFVMPKFPIPQKKSDEWFAQNGYNQTVKPDNMRLYGDNIKITPHLSSGYVDSFSNAIIVSSGDIDIQGWVKMTGVLFAPNGKVNFNGASFDGLVIARDGFYVTSGGSTINFKSIKEFIPNKEDFPLQAE